LYTVQRGQSVSIQMLVDLLLGASPPNPTRFALTLRGMEAPGINTNGTLAFTPDANWTFQTGTIQVNPSQPYYSIPTMGAPPTPPNPGGLVYSVPTTLNFIMGVTNASSLDDYHLEMVVAGRVQNSTFASSQDFYLRVTDVPEPSTLCLAASAIALCLTRRGRRRSRH
jgi:hypothetical protein